MKGTEQCILTLMVRSLVRFLETLGSGILEIVCISVFSFIGQEGFLRRGYM